MIKLLSTAFSSFVLCRHKKSAKRMLGQLAGALLLGLPLQAAAVDMLVSQLVGNPNLAVRGGLIVYSTSITNNTSDIANGVALVFVLDAQTSFVSVSDGACAYAAGPHTVTCSYATVAGDINGPGSAEIRNIDVTVRSLAGAGTTVTFGATVSTSDADTNPANDSLNQVTTIDNGADLALVLTGSPASLPAGSTLTYTAALSNAGPNMAGATSASTTLSPNLTYQSASGGGWSCGAAGQVVTCTRATAAVGALPDITIAAKITGAFTGTLSSTGVVTVSGSTTDFNNANDSSTANTTVTNGTDLSVTKTASTSILAGGQPMTFTLAPRNLGPFAAVSVTVSDSLPAGFTNLSAAGTGWTCSVMGLDVSCTRASYAVGATNNITINATAPAVVVLTPATNNASITAATPDGVIGNNSGSVTVSILPDGVDLSITKSKTPNPVAEGNDLVSTMRVTNSGPRAAASGEVSVVDTLPAGESFVALASGVNWTCGAQIGQAVTCTYNAALAVGASSSDLVLTTTAAGVGMLTNNACISYLDMGAFLLDPDNSNDCAGASALSTSGANSVDLQLTKSADLATLAWNSPTVTYTLTVTNSGPSSATGVVLTDPIPGYVPGNTVVTASLTGGTSTASFNCTTGATVSCTQSAGAMGSGSTAVFTVAVTRPLQDSSAQPGNVWTNTASVRSNDQGDFDPSNNTASASVQVDPLADLTVLNSVTPTSTPAGTNATYVLTIHNNGPSSAAGVTLHDVLTIPSGTVTFVSAVPSAGSCAAFDAGISTLDCNLGSMMSGSTATVTVVVRPDYMGTPPVPRDITNTATVAATTPESNGGNNSATSLLTVTPVSLDLMINNIDNVDPLGFVPASASPVFPDNVVTYRNVITNRGPSVATGLVLTYTMRPPAGKSITFLGGKVAATGQVYQNNCDNPGVQVTGPAIQTITCTLPELAANATTDLYLDFRVDSQPNTSGDIYSSTVAIVANDANEPEAVTANNSANQTTLVKMRADLQLSKAARAFIVGADAPAATLNFRQPFYYVMTLTNAGPGDSQATNLSDVLPAGLVLYGGGTSAPYNSAPYNTGPVWSTNNGTPTSGSCTGTSTISCAMGLLESGKEALIRIPVVAANTYSASVTNCASATTTEVDPNASNNTNVCSGAVAQQRSSIAGTVYADTNNDGVKSGGESGIANVAMRLNGTDIYGNTVTNLAATTDGSGNYIFINRTPGTYTITETQPAGYQDGIETAGTAGGTATGATGDAISAISLPVNAAATGYLFGELASMNGVCGSANGSTSSNAPTVNLCTAGNASSVTSGSGAYGWTCSGSNGGNPAGCNANWPTVGSGLGTSSVSGNGWAYAPQGNGLLETGGFIPVTGHAKSPPNLPPGFSFPYGLFDFVLTGGIVGSVATITITYPSALPAGAVYWKYGPTPAGNNCAGIACAAAHWYPFPAVMSGNTATLTITDGGLGDGDLTANGFIVDPGGPGVPVVVLGGVNGIATLTEWGMLMLSALMLGVGMAGIRRRHLISHNRQVN